MKMKYVSARLVLSIVEFVVLVICEFSDSVRAEVQTCPRRKESFRACASTAIGTDRWERSRWHPARVLLDRLRNRFGVMPLTPKELLALMLGGTRWPIGEPSPRSCSYCGGVHPADAVALIRRGWRVESTTKCYERYLHPPGSTDPIAEARIEDERFKTLIAEGKPFHEARETVLRERAERWQARSARVHEPIPPVKLYTQHFTESDRVAFNDALQRVDAREKATSGGDAA